MSSLVHIRVLPTAQRRDVNLDETVTHRSTDGDALFLVPGQSKEVTRDEWAFIKQHHGDFRTSIEVLRDADPEPVGDGS